MIVGDSVHVWTAHALAVTGTACATALFFEAPHVALVAAVGVVGGCFALRVDATQMSPSLAQWHSAAVHLAAVWFFWMVYSGGAATQTTLPVYASIATDAFQTLWGIYCATRLRKHIAQRDRAAALGVGVSIALFLSSPFRAPPAPLLSQEIRLATYVALHSSVAFVLVLRSCAPGRLQSFADHLYLFVATAWIPCVHWSFGVGGSAWLLVRTFGPIIAEPAKPKVERTTTTTMAAAPSLPPPPLAPPPAPPPPPSAPPKNDDQSRSRPSVGFILPDKTVVFPNKKVVPTKKLLPPPPPTAPPRRRPVEDGGGGMTETLFSREVEKMLSGEPMSAATLPRRKRMSDSSAGSAAPLHVPIVRDEATIRADDAAAAAADALSSLPLHDESSDDDEDTKDPLAPPPPLQLETSS